MRQLFDHIISDKGVNTLTEWDWKSATAAGLTAASLTFGNPGIANATAPKASVTQQEKGIDLGKLLHAIKQVESSGGKDTRTRYEPSLEKFLQKRLKTHKLRATVLDAVKKYGVKAIATSYGPYQMSALTAYDLGYTGDINDLKKEEVSKKYVEKYVRHLMMSSRTKNVDDVISAYNAGLGGIGSNKGYVEKVLKHYWRSSTIETKAEG